MTEFANPEAYEAWIGRWSKRLAPLFVRFADLSGGGHLLDVGTGTGALAMTLLETFENATIVGIDPAEVYVAYARERLRDDHFRLEVGDGQNLPFEASSFDAALALLVLQEFADAGAAVREMVRVTRPGGVVAASQWDFVDGLPMLSLFWRTAIDVVGTDEVRAAAARSMVVDHPDGRALERLWLDAGLVDVATERQEIAMTFADFDDYWAPFLSGVAPSASYAATLANQERETLKQRLRQTIGVEPDRPFSLLAHAWAVRGRVPLR